MSKRQADTDTYITIAKEKASSNAKSMDALEKVRQDNITETNAEIQQTVAEINKIKARKLLQDVKAGIMAPSNSVIERIFSGKTAEEISTILEKMTPQALENLLAMERANDTPASIRQQQQAPAQKSEMETVLTIIRIMKEMQAPQQPVQQQITLADVVKIVEIVRDKKDSTNPLEYLKAGMDLTKPAIEAVNKKDKEIMDLKMKELESKMPQDPIDTIKYVREMASTLGYNSGAKTEVDLKLEAMRQEAETDKMKIAWEKEKAQMESETEVAKYENIAKIFQGPIGQAIQNFGNAGADRVRGGTVKPIQAICPNCNKPTYVDANANTAVCGNCGVTLQRAAPEPSQPVATPVVPTPTHVDEQQQQEKEEVEEEESGHSEEETTE